MILPLATATLLLLHWFVRSCQFLYRQYLLYNKIKDLPGPEIKLPFFGNIDLLREIMRTNADPEQLSTVFYNRLFELCDQYGNTEHGLIRLWFGPFVPFIIISNPRTAQTLLANHDFLDKANFYNLFRFLVRDGIFTCTTRKWRLQKKELQEHFKFQALECYIDLTKPHLENFSKCIDQCLVENEGHCDNIERLVSNFVFDSVGDNLFNYKFKAQFNPNPRTAKIVHDLMRECFRRILKPWSFFFRNFLSFLVNFSLAKACLRKVLFFQKGTKALILSKYQKLQKEGTFYQKGKHVPMIDAMMLARMEKNKLTKVVEVENQTNTFLVAGHDTTTTSLTWILYELAHNAEVQSKLQAEIDDYLAELKEKNEPITLLGLKRLKYLDAVIKEALRLYPAGPLIGRHPKKDIMLADNVCVPAGADVIVFIYYYHKSEKYFLEPNRFMPERFMPEYQTTPLEAEQSPVYYNKAAYMPFVVGQRVCIGKEYGLLQTRLFLIDVLSRYSFEAHDKYGSTRPKFDFLLGCANFPLTFHKRPQVVI